MSSYTYILLSRLFQASLFLSSLSKNLHPMSFHLTSTSIRVPYISLHTALWYPLYSHHDLTLSQTSTNGICKTLPLPNTLISFPCLVTINWERSSICCGSFQAICSPTRQSSSWPNSTCNFWKIPRALCTGHTIAWPLIFKKILVTRLFVFLLPCFSWLKMVNRF